MVFLLVKTKAVFFIGFTIGGILALILMLAEDLISTKPVCNVRPSRLYRNLEEKESEVEGESYRKWLRLQNVKISKADMDELMYAKKYHTAATNSPILESDWLKSKIHITCVVFVEKIKLANAIKNTWAPHCNRIYYFGAEKDKRIPIIKFDIKLTSSWQLLCESIRYIWQDVSNYKISLDTQAKDKIEWLIFVKDDTMVIPENLRYFVAPMDFDKGYYLGHPITLWQQAYNVAQAGYVLSKGSFLKIVSNFNTTEKCATGGKYWKKEDYDLGKHLGSMGIYPLDTRNEDLSGIFHGYSLQSLLWGVAKSGSYWTHSLYPIGPDCCSPRSITFSAGVPDEMYNTYYMLYRLNVYKGNGTYSNQPAATDIPDQEMWKIILEEEFNITNINQISSQQYYKIWRDRYSEPEQFIKNNYKNMPDVLSSLLTAYEAEKKLDQNNTLI
ncbi:C1GALT1-specific chaperone 1 [Neodiprion pinetum]|uniref:C1GALT1-specific chaperone 1 n=1 Tax=Neodiprion pinetum TaxID=441929 RepID=UPI001EDEDFB9|nr:C1GALT1-specific chaperone 1-like [Neodiprion pinetum]XP_046468635.1 C1GALT1-specific chaperone 1-like [Neodiprion pinetum]